MDNCTHLLAATNKLIIIMTYIFSSNWMGQLLPQEPRSQSSVPSSDPMQSVSILLAKERCNNENRNCQDIDI